MSVITYSLALGETFSVDTLGFGHQWTPAVASRLVPGIESGFGPPVSEVFFAYGGNGFQSVAGHHYVYDGQIETGSSSYTITPEAGNQTNPDVAIGGFGPFGVLGNTTIVAYQDAASQDIQWRIVGSMSAPGGPNTGPSGDSGGEFPFNALDVNPAVAALSNYSTFVIVGQSIITGADSDIRFSLISSTGVQTIQTEHVASPDVPGQSTYDETPAVAAGEGGFYVTWTRSAPGDQDTYLRRFSNAGVAMTDAIQVNEDIDTSETTAASTAIAVSYSTGNVMVVNESNAWSGLAGADITGRVYNASGTPITASFRVNEQTALDQTTPSVTSLDNGQFLVTWASGSLASGNRDIVARLFSSTGEALTGDVVLASAVSREDYPDIASLYGSAAIVTWEHYYDGDIGSPDGSDSAVEARSLLAIRDIQGDGLPEELGFDDGMTDTISGNNGDDRLFGYFGNDTVNGNSGHDTIDGGNGADLLSGGEGNDVITAGLPELEADGDETPVYAYNDTASGGEGDDVFRAGGGADSFDGGIDQDTIDFDGAGPGGVSFSLLLQGTAQAIPRGSLLATGVEHLSGTRWADVLTGDGAANRLIGAAGDDTLNGGLGIDTMTGGAGNDTFYVSAGADQTIEAAGGGTADLVLSTISRTLSVNIEKLALLGNANIDGNGNTIANFINGNAGNNILRGYEGNDTLGGGLGNDILLGGTGRDTLSPGADSVRDIIRYAAPSESSGTTRDLVLGMDLNGEDKFDFLAIPTSLGATVTVGALNAASFNADLASAVNAGLAANGAILFDPSSGDQNLSGHIYLVVDVDGNGSYASGADYVIQLSGTTGALSLDDFI